MPYAFSRKSSFEQGCNTFLPNFFTSTKFSAKLSETEQICVSENEITSCSLFYWQSITKNIENKDFILSEYEYDFIRFRCISYRIN